MKVMRLKETYPTAKVELWCEDEQRLGLKSIVRKVWSPIGQRPLREDPPAIRVDLPLRLRTPRKRRGPLAHPPHRERGTVLGGARELRQGGGSRNEEAHPARGRSSRLAHGEEA